jgi:hypothetical protein
VDVLIYRLGTAAVFHLEMSALNTRAAANAVHVGGCRVDNQIKNKIEKT